MLLNTEYPLTPIWKWIEKDFIRLLLQKQSPGFA